MRSPAGSVGAGSKPWSAPFPRPKRPPRQLQRLRVLDVARERDHRVRRSIGRGPERPDPGGRQRAHVRFLAADLPTQRRRSEHRLLEQDLGHLRRVVEVPADLLDDDLALAVDLGRVERRPADQLAEHGHRPLGLPARDADPVDRGLAVRCRVERAADPFDRLAQGAGGRIRGGALERQVLQEVGHARLLGRLEARARLHVRGDRHRPGGRQRRGDHARPVGQRRPFEHRRDGTRGGVPDRGIERPAPEGRRPPARIACDAQPGRMPGSQPCRKNTTKAMETTHISGWISLILPLTALITTHEMKPAPMPTVMS